MQELITEKIRDFPRPSSLPCGEHSEFDKRIYKLEINHEIIEKGMVKISGKQDLVLEKLDSMEAKTFQDKIDEMKETKKNEKEDRKHLTGQMIAIIVFLCGVAIKILDKGIDVIINYFN